MGKETRDATARAMVEMLAQHPGLLLAALAKIDLMVASGDPAAMAVASFAKFALGELGVTCAEMAKSHRN